MLQQVIIQSCKLLWHILFSSLSLHGDTSQQNRELTYIKVSITPLDSQAMKFIQRVGMGYQTRYRAGWASTKPKLPPPFSLRFTRHKKYISLDSLSPHYVFGIHLDIPLHYGFVAFVSTLFLKTPSLLISTPILCYVYPFGPKTTPHLMLIFLKWS
jgi:hypothetical protein